MNNILEDEVTETALLKSIEFELKRVIPGIHLAEIKISRDDYVNYITDSIVLSVRGSIFGERAGSLPAITYPSNWWQAVKERFFPKWLKGKYPVEYVTYTYDIDCIYPDLKISLPEHKHSLIYTRTYRCQ